MKLPQDIELVKRLDQLIRLKATGTPEQLGKRLELSRRQVYRIIDEMKALGFPIACCRSKKTFYYEKEVKFVFEICVLEEKEIQTTIGGKNFENFLGFFASVPYFGTERVFLCGR